MSDFTANIKAKLDLSNIPSQLKQISNNTVSLRSFKIDSAAISSQIQNALNSQQFTLNIQNVNLGNAAQNINSQMGNAGAQAGQQFGTQFSQSAQNLINRMQLRLDTGDIQTRLDAVNAKMQSLGNVSQTTSDNIARLNEAFKTMTSTDSTVTMEQKTAAYQEFCNILPIVQNQLNQTSTAAKNEAAALRESEQAQQTLTKSATLSNNMETWLNNNTKAAKTFGDQIRELQSMLNNNTDASVLSRVNSDFANIKSQAKMAGLTTDSWAKSFGNVTKQVLGLSSSVMVIRKVINVVKEGIDTITELDTALVDLKKTTTASASEVEQFYYSANEQAKKFGVTTKDIIQSTADWSRLGYDLEDSKTMSEVSSIFASISPDMDVDTATNGLVSAMKAFDIEAEDALDGIASKINEIGNTQAVSNGDIVNVLTRSSSAMKEANNTLEETIALGTAA